MPTVSIIVPCYNEEATIRLLLEAIYKQSYPRHEMEVIIADGLSTDGTLQEIAAFKNQHPGLAVQAISNARRNIPAALNCAIQASSGSIIVRLDAHSAPYPDYVTRCVQALEAGSGANVGGVWEIQPAGAGWISRAIAIAAAHPLGAGDARYRYTQHAQAVDTVPFGAFQRSLVEQIGGFDETLLTNEDYEFNVRVRQSGGRVWLDPAIRSIYYARANLALLARQYWRYGFWKAIMLQRYPGTIRWRQALPPLFVLSLAGLALLGFVWRPAAWLLALEVGIYGLVLAAAGLRLAVRRRDPALLPGIPLAIAVMHLAWGSAFLWSQLSLALERAFRKQA